MNLFQSILLGSVSSLLATIIWVFFVYLYEFSASNKITLLLEECDSSTRLMINSVKYTRYMVVLTEVEKLTALYLQINNYLKPLNYSSIKRKYIKLIIFNMIRVLNIFKNIEVGYNEEEELKARCETFKRKYLYDIQVNKNEDINFMIISICFLQELVNGLGIKKPILKSLERFNRSNEYHESILDSLVECNSFKEGFSLNYFMNKEVLSKKEYNKIGKKIISMRKKKTAI